MDPVTHTLVGAGLSNAFFRKRLPESFPILMIASNWPDIDVAALLTFKSDSVLMRRTFGHSFVLMPFLALGLAWLLRRRYRSVPWVTMLGLVFVGMIFHVFSDLVNTFGVVVFWPLSLWRPEFSIIFILDLILTGLLAAPLLLPREEKWSRIALLCAALYVAGCFAARRRAQAVLSPTAAAADFSYVFPEPLGPHRWRGVVRRRDVYELYLLRPLFGKAEPRGQIRTELGDPAVEAARASVRGKDLEWFFKAPVWRVESADAAGTTVSVSDLRFTTLVVSRGSPFVYRFRVARNGTVELL